MKQEKWFVQKLFMRFFIPALFSSLGLAIGGVADCLYVGKMLSEEGLYIIGVASPIYMIYTTWSVAMAVGGSIHFSQALGEGDAKRGNQIFYSTIIFDFIGLCILTLLGMLFLKPLVHMLGVASGSIFYADTMRYVKLMLLCCPVLFMQAPLQYFVHADDDPKLASLALVMGCVFDCLSGYILIVVNNCGVNGSVWATLIGAVVMEFICLLHFCTKKGCLKLKRPSGILPEIAGDSLKTGFATSMQYFYKFVILLAFNRILLKISGENAVAVYDISTNAASLALAVIDAVILAMIPLVSTFFGERNKEGIRSSFWISVVTGVCATAAISAVLMIFSKEFCGLVGVSQGLIAEGAFAVRMVVLSSVLACVNNVLAAYFQNIDSERISYIIIFMREFAVLFICGVLFSKGSYPMFWYTYLVTEAVVFVVTVAMIFVKKTVRKQPLIQFEEGAVFSETFSGSCEKISEVCERLQEFLEQEHASVKKAYLVTLAVDETCRLIAENTDDLMLQLTLIVTGEEYVLHIRDNAGKFNPMEIDDEDEHGLGLKIVKKQAKEYYYRQFVGFNTLTMSIAKENSV